MGKDSSERQTILLDESIQLLRPVDLDMGDVFLRKSDIKVFVRVIRGRHLRVDSID